MGFVKKLKTGFRDFQLRNQYSDFLSGKQKAMNIILKNRKELGSFQDMLFRHKALYDNPDKQTHHKKVMMDYQEFYEPSNNVYDSSAQSGRNDRPSFEDLEMMADERIGFGKYCTTIFAGKTVRNGWDFYDWEGNLKKHADIMKALYKAKFYTEQIQWVKQELIYGTSFLLKYWSDHDQFDKPPPKKPYLACKAFPPTILSPTNIWESGKGFLHDNDELWNFRGGKYKTVSIHRDRVEILNTRPNPYDYIGYSIFEPIYLPASAYMNLIINGIKMVAKFGNVVTAYKMPVANPSLKMYREFQNIINEMKANFTFVMGKDEEMEFIETKLGTGLYEFGEFLKEDMAAGTGLPLNQTYGRADGGGFTHHSDLNLDHEIVSHSTLAASRPPNKAKILAYEVPSSTELSPHPFIPNFYISLSKNHLERKIKTYEIYEYEIKKTRSIRKVRILATKRGDDIMVNYAEAFKLIREVIK